MIKVLTRTVLTSSILLCALPVNAALAPVVPDAGQTIRELQQQPELNVPKSTPPLQPEKIVAPKAEPNVDVRMMVKSINISGNSEIATSELEALLADLVGGEHSLAELNEGAARISVYYHERGYVVSRAYIPPQEIKDGAVTISVQEGRIGDLLTNNQSRLLDEQVNEYLNVIKSGDVLQAAPVERALLLLNETPGVSVARATLQPGASVGLADIEVDLLPSAAYVANIQLDNYGNYYTGENRLGAELALNSPLKIGDLFTLRALATDQDLTYAYFAYQVPVGGSGLRVGVSHSSTSYRLGKELTPLQTLGTASIGSFFTIYPFIRSQKGNLSAIFTAERKQLNDEITSITIDKEVLLATLGVKGDRKDKFGSGGITMFNLSLAKGSLSMDDASLSFDKTTANTNGSFSRLNYNLNRLQRISDSYTLSLALTGQYANKNLNSSEQFSLGGAYGVRAYPQGEALGDEGHLVTVEIRHNFGKVLEGVIFYDAGKVIINHDPYLSGLNTRSLSGRGVGVNAKVFGINIKAYLAVRGNGGQPTAEPATVNHKSRLWLQMGKYF